MRLSTPNVKSNPVLLNNIFLAITDEVDRSVGSDQIAGGINVEGDILFANPHPAVVVNVTITASPVGNVQTNAGKDHPVFWVIPA